MSGKRETADGPTPNPSREGNRYRRPKSAKGTNLDYDKVDWDALQAELDGALPGEKKRVLWTWAIRLRCSKDTLYQGLKCNREGKTRWQED